MIAPAIVKAIMAVGVVGELVTLAVAQTTGVDRTVVIGAALTFGGLLIASVTQIILQQTSARNAMKAEEARAVREAERELREEMRAEKARELLEQAAVKTEQIHTLVNSKDDKQTRLIAELTAEVKELNRKALAKAEAAPAIGPLPPVDPSP